MRITTLFGLFLGAIVVFDLFLTEAGMYNQDQILGWGHHGVRLLERLNIGPQVLAQANVSGGANCNSRGLKPDDCTPAFGAIGPCDAEVNVCNFPCCDEGTLSECSIGSTWACTVIDCIDQMPMIDDFSCTPQPPVGCGG